MEAGDLLIRRARNGWVVIIAVAESLDGEHRTLSFDTSVYADDKNPSSEVAESRALLSAIRDQFEGHFQSKYRGGIVALVREQGRYADDYGTEEGEE
jgi:hypothetical protein